MPSTLPGFLALIALILALTSLIWWLLIKTEGVYLGRWTVIKLYDLYAARYEAIKAYDPPLEARFLSRPLLQETSPHHDPLVLDLATGTGRLPRALLQHPDFQGRVIAVDLSRRMLHYAMPRVLEGLYYKKVYLLHAPAEKLPFPDDSFDVVACLEALEFMPRPAQVAAEMLRVLRPGGVFLVTNRRGLDAKLMPFKTWTQAGAVAFYADLGLADIRYQSWQLDYDLVWARKPGDSPHRGPLAFEAVAFCPQCRQVAFQAETGGYRCGACGYQLRQSPVDEVLELGTW